MKINKLTIKNFKSIGNSPVEFEFNKNSLTLLRGKPGSGKTAIMASIVFCLYGKNIDEKGRTKATLPTSKLINDLNKKETLVTIELSNGYKISRGLKPNVFTIEKDGKDLAISSSKKIDDEYLVKYCLDGVALEDFLKTCFLSDRNASIPFLYMTANERKTHIENILDLKRVQSLSEHLKTFINTNNLEKDRLESKKTFLEQTINNETSNVNQQKIKANMILKEIGEFQNNKNAKLKELEENLITIKKTYENDIININNAFENDVNEYKAFIATNYHNMNNNYKISKNNIIECKIKSLEELENNFKQNKKNKKNEAITKLKSINDNILKYEDCIKSLSLKIELIQEEFENIDNELVIVNQEQLNKSYLDVDEMKKNLKHIESETITLKAQKKAYDEADTTICLHCGEETKIGKEFDYSAYDKIMLENKEKYVNILNFKNETEDLIKYIENQKKVNEEVLIRKNDIEKDLVSKKAELNLNKQMLDDYLVQKNNFNDVIEKDYNDFLSKYEEDKKRIENQEKQDLKNLEEKHLNDKNNFMGVNDNKSKTLKETYSNNLENKKIVFESDLKNLEEQKKIIENTEPPKPLEVNQDYLKKLEDDMTKLNLEIDENYNQSIDLKTMKMVINDKEHKRKAFESYLPIFENKLNELLEKFFEEGDIIIKAKIKDDFDIIFMKGNKEVIPGELSSGQKSIVNIATSFSFLHLLQIKYKNRLNILLIDEILDVSISEFINPIVEYLKEVSNSTSINIISHSTILEDEIFDRIIDVHRKTGFSKYTINEY